MGLSAQHKAFADYWIETRNRTEAAKRAGYSEKTAAVQGSRLLRNVNIKAYIDEILSKVEQERVENAIATEEQVLEFLTRVMKGEEKDAFGLDASLSDRVRAANELKKYSTEKRKLELEVIKLENQLKEKDNTEEPVKDNFLEAMKGTMQEVWTDE